MPRMSITERDAKGRIVRSQGDYLEILAAGRRFNWASPYRRMCARCRRSAMRGSDFCWSHDPEYRKRRAQKAVASNDRDRVSQALIRHHRATMQKIWRRDPWFNAMTVWFAPQIEAAFRLACANAALPVETISPFLANTLRWQWRAYQFDRTDWPNWELAVNRVRRRQREIGPPPEDWVYQRPGDRPPHPPIIAVMARAPSRRRAAAVGKRATPKMKAVLRKVASDARGKTDSVEAVDAFLAKHHRDLRTVLVRLGDAADDQLVRNRLARAHASALRGEAAGYRAIQQLLREVGSAPKRSS